MYSANSTLVSLLYSTKVGFTPNLFFNSKTKSTSEAIACTLIRLIININYTVLNFMFSPGITTQYKRRFKQQNE